MNRSDYVTKLITRDEWKLICQIRQVEICRNKITYLKESEAIAEEILELRAQERMDNL